MIPEYLFVDKSSSADADDWRCNRRVADVEIISPLPRHLVGTILLCEDDSHSVLIVLYRVNDRIMHTGWSKGFMLNLKFPDECIYEIEVPPSYRLPDGHSLIIHVSPTTVLRERNSSSSSRIPRVIFHVPEYPLVKSKSSFTRHAAQNARLITQLIQRDYSLIVVEDRHIWERIVRESNMPELIRAFDDNVVASRSNSLIIGYYLLYKYGGIYWDGVSILRVSLDNFTSRISSTGEPLVIAAGGSKDLAFLGSEAGSPIILQLLRHEIQRRHQEFINVLLKQNNPEQKFLVPPCPQNEEYVYAADARTHPRKYSIVRLCEISQPAFILQFLVTILLLGILAVILKRYPIIEKLYQT